MLRVVLGLGGKRGGSPTVSGTLLEGRLMLRRAPKRKLTCFVQKKLKMIMNLKLLLVNVSFLFPITLRAQLQF
jgi:hypothetical protein